MLLDAGMGVRRHDHDAVALLRQVDIVDIAAAAGDEAGILDPRHGLADAEFGHALFLLDQARQTHGSLRPPVVMRPSGIDLYSHCRE